MASISSGRRGAYEAVMLDHRDFVTEGASSNAWIVDATGAVITRKLGVDILP